MCGIVGFSGLSDVDGLRRGTDLLAHRGPDGKGVFHNGKAKVGLGHTRLSIIDLSSLGSQPMSAEDDSVTLVFNGEIYNFRELRQGLEKKARSFKGNSDTEVVLQLYLEYGIEFLPKLNGIFALAIFDGRIDSLFVARDALGVKPIYYFATEKTFSFSSEIKSLMELMQNGVSEDFAAIQRYLTFLWCPGDGTAADGVKKVLPGEVLTIRAGRLEKRSSWYRSPQSRAKKSTFSTNAAIGEVRQALTRAVERQMVSDVPIGAFLSGGLDSSAIVALASQKSPDLKCFTIEPVGGSDKGFVEDLPYAFDVAKHLSVDLEVVKVGSTDLARDLVDMVCQLDEPLADPAPLNVLYISRLARERGIKVLLSGTGGDDLFTGYRRHVAVKYDGAWSWLPKSVRQAAEAFSLRLDQRTAMARKLSRLLNNAAASGDERLVSYFTWARRDDLHSLYSNEMRRAVEGVRAEQPMLDFLKSVDPELRPIDRMLALEQRFFLADHNLIYTDKMSMAAGVEVRVPFLDLELVELAASIPERLKLKGMEGKWILKKAMEPYLPRDVIYRQKTGFGAPLRRWIRHDLSDLVDQVLSPHSIQSRGIFDAEAVSRLVADNRSGRRDASYTIFSLLCIEIWLRRFKDGVVRTESLVGADL